MRKDSVALWSLFVDAGGERYTTQITADNPKLAVQRLLASSGLADMLKRRTSDGWPGSFTAEDIHLLIPMEGLVNVHLCQLGREGKYVSVVMAETVGERHA
jgi:hypothetical protein